MRHLFRAQNGVFVEPVPYLYQELIQKAAPHHICLRCAVGAKLELKRPFFYVHEAVTTGQPQWLTKIGSLDRSHIVKHVGVGTARKGIVEITVSVMTADVIRDICCLYPLDLLMIDAEGADYDILVNMSFEDPPRLLIFEHKHMTEEQISEICELLDCVGYSWEKGDRDILAERRAFL